jgi:hypothetical protein
VVLSAALDKFSSFVCSGEAIAFVWRGSQILVRIYGFNLGLMFRSMVRIGTRIIAIKWFSILLT